jgi:hypothetical protein
MSITIAQQFASLLDENRFEEAGHLLSADCHYNYSEGNYQGASNIINIYRQLHLQSVKIFDEMVYTSSVEDIGSDVYKINFTDKIRKAILWHEYNWYQVIRIKDDLIIDITNHDIPDEQVALRAFYTKAMNMANIKE